MTTYVSTSALPAGARFSPRELDGAPPLLNASYRLRYQVYCLERGFLDPADYPAGMELDEFDRYSVHVGAIDEAGQLAGTARLVMPTGLGLPLFQHLTVDPAYAAVCAGPTVVEISRLSVSRACTQRQGSRPDGHEAPFRSRGARARGQGEGEVFLTITRALYQASKRLGVTHWLAASERSLYRMLLRFGLPFQVVGPESDYYGLVAPYLMEIAALDRIIANGDRPRLEAFTRDLDPYSQGRLRLRAAHPVAERHA